MSYSEASKAEVKDVLSPVTAFAFVNLHRLYLLAGEAQYLKIFDSESNELVAVKEIFQSQAIHGVVSSARGQDSASTATVMIWGGRFIQAYDISSNGDQGHLQMQRLSNEIEIEDWILDGCFTYMSNEDASWKAVLLTAHNVLLELDYNLESRTGQLPEPRMKTLSSGPDSMLYSAHLVCTEEDILVAAGTVFGEVLFWSFSFDVFCLKYQIAKAHQTLTGHEGSVFGVRLFDKIQLANGSVTRVLASCSDDRTIRIWNVSDSGPVRLAKRVDTCLATVMGHASRIWGLRFLSSSNTTLRIMSLGEDGTAQTWCLAPASEKEPVNRLESIMPLVLQHESTYAYHSGKNIWAAATHLGRDGCQLCSTGGADGRIVAYGLNSKNSLSETSPKHFTYTMTEVRDLLNILCHDQEGSVPKPISRTRQIFDEMKGSWRLSRSLQSAFSSYPSGRLGGSVSFEERPVSDSSYDAECLYSEQGDFRAQQGFIMRASRKYVYRYQESTDSISVWFVKTNGSSAVDYFFHTLGFEQETEKVEDANDGAMGSLRASGHHLCVADDYDSDYLFELDNGKLKTWHVKYTVKGPQKDYISDAAYTRNTFLNDTESSDIGPLSSKQLSKQLSKAQKPLKDSSDAFRSYVWVSESHFLSTTEQGNVLLGTVNTKRKQSGVSTSDDDADLDVTWSFIEQKDPLKSSAIMSGVISMGIAFLTGTNGEIFIYEHNRRRVEILHTVQAKVAYLKADMISRDWKGLQGNGETKFISVVAKSLGSQLCHILCIGVEQSHWYLVAEQNRALELRKDFIVTSSCFVEDQGNLILGSRNGNLCVCDISSAPSALGRTVDPAYISQIHGQEAVTSIHMMPFLNSGSSGNYYHILTTGRDGRFAIHQTPIARYGDESASKDVSLIHLGTASFGPNIEGACLRAETNDILLWGFRSKYFVVWNESKKIEIMTVECGGAHRNWAYSQSATGTGGGNFVWTKASVCNVYSQPQISHQVLQSGGHGREIKAMAISPLANDCDNCQSQLIATGAEDTAIRIFDTKLNCLSIQTKHKTGIQKLHWSRDGSLLFSAAGCEEFFVWRVQRPLCYGIAVGMYCEGSTQPVTEERDLRIMDFAVAPKARTDIEAYLITMVYSDSSVRVFRYSADTKATNQSLILLVNTVYTTCCLTAAMWLPVGVRSQFCTAGSDGRLALWSVTDADQEPPNAGIIKVMPVHQSSIKCSAVAELSNGDFMIATGGDDQAIAFTCVTFHSDSPALASTTMVPNAHASAVTALAYLGATAIHNENRFATVGNDQRLRTWIVTILPSPGLSSTSSNASIGEARAKKIQVRGEHNAYTSVADASSLDAYVGGNGNGNPRDLVIAGIGMEKWSLPVL